MLGSPEYSLNGWRDIIDRPVVAQESAWSHEGLEDILKESIRLVTLKALQDNQGKIYTTLSGGVDSSFCLAVISEVVPKGTEVHTFTLGGSNQNPDITFARAVSQQFQTSHTEIIPDAAERQAAVNAFVAHFGQSAETTKMLDRGDLNIWLVYEKVARAGARSVIAHDGIDELLGGYWKHCSSFREGQKEQEKVFMDYWKELEPEHLIPLEAIARVFNIEVLLPFLQSPVVDYISRIPVGQRASLIETENNNWVEADRKKPLREIALRNGIRRDIVYRPKRGFVSASSVD